MAEVWQHGRKPSECVCVSCSRAFFDFDPDATLCPKCRDEMRCELGSAKRCAPQFCAVLVPLTRRR